MTHGSAIRGMLTIAHGFAPEQMGEIGWGDNTCVAKLEFDENGRLQFKTEALEADARYDEIGSGLKIKQLQQDKKELLESLEMYYKVFFLGDIPEEELKKTSDSED